MENIYEECRQPQDLREFVDDQRIDSICSIASNRSRTKKSQPTAIILTTKRMRGTNPPFRESLSKVTWKGVIRQLKRDNIIRQFLDKLKMNIPQKELPQSDEFFSTNLDNISSQVGEYEQIKTSLPLPFAICSILFHILLFFLSSLKICFSIFKSSMEEVFQICSLVMAISIVGQCIISLFMRGQNKEKIQHLKSWIILQKKYYGVALCCCLGLSYAGYSSFNIIASIIIFRQIFLLLRNLKSLQIQLSNHFSLSHYWQLLKILLFNFLIAHCLSILLNFIAQAGLNSQGVSGWYSLKNLQNATWFEQYIWGYYWGTTIMLTIGFGDIYATNQTEAMSLVFIETFACIILAYNISEVSKIMSKLNQVDQQKNSKLKSLHNLCKRNNIQKQFQKNIEHYIQKSVNEKYECCYKQQEKVIQQMPERLKIDIKKQINKNIFVDMPFFQDLTKKTLNIIAQRLVNVVAHPQQIILRQNERWKILILRVGVLGLTYRKGLSKKNGIKIQEFSVGQNESPKLLSLGFINNVCIQGDLRSFSYSIFNQLTIEELQQLLKEANILMFEHFCQLRDKNRLVQNGGSELCKYCKYYKHDKFECPRLHYFPYTYKVIAQYIQNKPNNEKQYRRSNVRIKEIFKQSAIKMAGGNKVRKTYNSSVKGRTNSIDCKQESSIYESDAFLTENGSSHCEMIRKMQTCEIRIEEILDLLKKKQSQQIQLDLIKNYKKYYPKFNAEELQARFRKIRCTIRQRQSLLDQRQKAS